MPRPLHARIIFSLFLIAVCRLLWMNSTRHTESGLTEFNCIYFVFYWVHSWPRWLTFIITVLMWFEGFFTEKCCAQSTAECEPNFNQMCGFSLIKSLVRLCISLYSALNLFALIGWDVPTAWWPFVAMYTGLVTDWLDCLATGWQRIWFKAVLINMRCMIWHGYADFFMMYSAIVYFRRWLLRIAMDTNFTLVEKSKPTKSWGWQPNMFKKLLRTKNLKPQKWAPAGVIITLI